MTPIKAQLVTLIQAGLYRNNLRALLPLARQLFHQRPALYGTLIYIFQSLDDEYDGVQGVPTSRYNHIVQQLTQPLLDALDAEFDPALRLLEKLNALHEAFFTL
ncbi:MAG TPA: hypothetical protein VGY99_08510 [Candidatus Binataceae bacterium]|jgi:hypothetical protein|nr:hypothetical protein [Candidatus Binataceae bacterium]